jgi:hypothetical protein
MKTNKRLNKLFKVALVVLDDVAWYDLCLNKNTRKVLQYDWADTDIWWLVDDILIEMNLSIDDIYDINNL